MCALKDAARQERSGPAVCVPDEESEELDERAPTRWSSAGWAAISRSPASRPTCTSGSRPRACWRCGIEVHGRAAHSSTPWLGDNAVLKAIDVFRAIESLPFSRESSEMFDRPSINLGRIHGGDAINKVPDECTMAVDVRYLPGQDPSEILDEVRSIPEIDVTRTFIWPPVSVARDNPYVQALREAVGRSTRGEAMSVGRDGASDAARSSAPGSRRSSSGPGAAGHHGPDEWVSVASLARYRRALGDFVRELPIWLADGADAERTGGRAQGDRGRPRVRRLIPSRAAAR